MPSLMCITAELEDRLVQRLGPLDCFVLHEPASAVNTVLPSLGASASSTWVPVGKGLSLNVLTPLNFKEQIM